MTAIDLRLATSTRNDGVNERLDLDPDEATCVDALAARCVDTFDGPDDPAFQRSLGDLAEQCPLRMRQAMREFRTSVHAESLVVSGVRVDESALDPTPPSWKEAGAVGVRHAFAAAIVASTLGECIGWGTQQAGRMVTDVVPTQGMEQSLVSSSSAAELGWHTEDAFSDFRADYVGLLGLRDTAAAATTIASVAVQEVPTDILATLFESRFVTSPDDAHDSRAADSLRATPILSGHPEAPMLRIDRDFTDVLTEDDDGAREALRWVCEHLDGRLVDLTMQPGDLAFLNNRKVVHGRRPFTPRYDGSDRWLKRVNVVVDLARTHAGRHAVDRRTIG